MRSLLFFLAVIGVFILIMLAISRLQNLKRFFQPQPQPQPQPDSSKTTNEEKPMVKCAHCGVYLPEKEAIYDNQENANVFCSQSHQKAFQRLNAKD